MEEIESESKFMWKLIIHILLLPVNIILFLFGRRDFEDIFQPFKDIFKFIFAPKFTIFIIILNTIIFFVGAYYLSDKMFESFIHFPSDLFNVRYHTVITAGFLHANIYHLLGNLLGIFIFGRVVERKLGFFKTFLIYFGALIISALFSSAIHHFILGDNIGIVGASGALMGLVAAAILLDPFYITHELILPVPVMLTGWLALYADISGLLNPLQGGIGHFAHIGGFISVGIVLYLLGIEERSKLKNGLIINIVSFIIAIIIYYLLIEYGYLSKILPYLQRRFYF